MTKIGILTCSNTTQELGCSSYLCFQDFNERAGAFARYKDLDDKPVIAGIINCAGCPTAHAPEKLLGRIKSLTEIGLNAIHLATCVTLLCPFKERYLNMLKNTFPDIDFIEGTHGHAPGVTPEMFVGAMKHMLTQQKPSISSIIKKTIKKP
ncbi:MAG TPA: CGGC domain-containing protein [Syntrophorhabdaceae bacterium]|nr:CGGC domain-containing protein [Syntrophorhabdaceae bacterium]HPU29207.1 CGGC domain-containing protein [Syntrophorhabdaceae bacterium]